MVYLTSLRGLAALLVVFFHVKHYLLAFSEEFWFWFVKNGFLAVDFFFLLSGFILAYTYHARMSDLTLQKFFTFMGLRFARIYPLHLLVLLLFVLVPLAHWITGRELPEQGFSLASFFAKLFLMDTWWTGYFETWNVPSWSISAEWMAYLLFPVLLYLCQTLKKGFIPLGLLALSALMIVTFKLRGEASIGQDINNLGVLRCLIEFCMGILVFRLSASFRIGQGAGYLLLIAALLAFYAGVKAGISDYYFAPLCFAGILLGLISTSGVIHRALSIKPLVYIGEISYSIYMVHYWVLYMMTMFFLETGEIPSLIWIGLYTLATIVFSAFTYHFVEVPFRNRIAGGLRGKL